MNRKDYAFTPPQGPQADTGSALLVGALGGFALALGLALAHHLSQDPRVCTDGERAEYEARGWPVQECDGDKAAHYDDARAQERENIDTDMEVTP